MNIEELKLRLEKVQYEIDLLKSFDTSCYTRDYIELLKYLEDEEFILLHKLNYVLL